MPAKTRAITKIALTQAIFGSKHAKAQVMKGFGAADVLEIRVWDIGGTFRVMYTTRFKEAIYVLHAFKKKSKTGIATPKQEIDLLRRRLEMAGQVNEATYGGNHGKGKKRNS